jgi:hypothetical protein
MNLKFLTGMFRPTASPPPNRFPPVPAWRPDFRPSLDVIVERMHYYAEGKRDFVVFENGTCVVVPKGLSDEDAKAAALQILAMIYRAHPDMNPTEMDDGNILVRYNHPAFNIVPREFAHAHWTEIDEHYREALTESEVMINAQGQPNVFDERGKLGLYARCFMFMDAQEQRPARLERAKAAPEQ